MIKFWSICQNTFVQTIRQPVYGILILATFAVLALSVPLSGWTMASDYETADQRMLEDLGLSTLLMSGLLIAAFSASGVLAREIEDRTVLTVVSKPVSRATFVLGKFAGVSGAVGAAFYLCAIVFLMAVRHKVMPTGGSTNDWVVITLGVGAVAASAAIAMIGNYAFGWSFSSSAIWSLLVLLTAAMLGVCFLGHGWKPVPFGQGLRPELLTGIVLIFLGVMVLTAVAVAASTRVGQVMTLLICLTVFAVGSLHSWLFDASSASILTGRSLDLPVLQYVGWLFPKLTYAYPPNAPGMDKPIPADYVLYTAGYYLAYICGIVAVGVALFQTRGLEASTASSVPGAVGALGVVGRAAAIVAGVAGVLLASSPQFHSLRGIGIVIALIAAGVALWLLWGFFGRGARWSWWVVGLMALTALGWNGYLMAVSWLSGGNRQPTAVVVALLASVAVVVILALPRTRLHFNENRTRRGPKRSATMSLKTADQPVKLGR